LAKINKKKNKKQNRRSEKFIRQLKVVISNIRDAFGASYFTS